MIRAILILMIIQYIPSRPPIMDIMAWGCLLLEIIIFIIKVFNLGKESK